MKFTYSFFGEVFDNSNLPKCREVNFDSIAQRRAKVAADGRCERFVAHYPPADEAPACAFVRRCPFDEAYPGLFVVGQEDEVDTENRHAIDYEVVLVLR